MATEKTNAQRLKDLDYLIDAPISGAFFQKVAQAVIERRVPMFDPASGKAVGETSLASLAGWQNGTSYVASREGEATRKELAGLRAAVTALATEKGIKLEDIQKLLEENRQQSSVSIPDTLTFRLQNPADSDAPKAAGE